jgi:hypothetical protein
MRHNSHNSTHNASLFAPHPYVPWWVHDEARCLPPPPDPPTHPYALHTPHPPRPARTLVHTRTSLDEGATN